ncbi:hypothetical protein IFM89_000085 [Coptis chinensis]|uniref:MULE transposase domain-containing protein n=1 Tax=Coptis chinensis TaxID=261450 RepID=A0A835I295_9MAGN|nr:hypothetical protein IFM89_000085 [Coptis chinensis]
MIKTDAEIHSLACYYFAKKELTVEVKATCSVSALGCSVPTLACSSYAPGESSSSNSLVVDSCANGEYKTITWVYNFSGGVGQRFELGAVEFRLKVLEFSSFLLPLGLYPLAMGVVNGKDEAKWYWFLDKFKGAFGYERRYAFLSDQHHGLLVNIPLVFPGSYHSFCLWHLKNNLRVALSKTDSVSRHLVKLFSDCAYAPTQDKFQKKMVELRTSG